MLQAGTDVCYVLALLHQGSLVRSVPSPLQTPYLGRIIRPSRNTDIAEGPYNETTWSWRKKRMKEGNEWSDVFKETRVA